MTDARATALVFNIQRFSLHDGPGIRNLVFMKGCPLRCQWCSNPESQVASPEIFYRRQRCLGFRVCGLCVKRCPAEAIARGNDDKARIERSKCTNCGQCADECPSRALEVVGRRVTVAEVLQLVEKDQTFHLRSGGGITVSGGDPLVQANFVADLLAACRRMGMDTAIETAGHGKWEQVEAVARHADLIIYDAKSMDDEKHRIFTGASTKVIKDNLIRLSETFPNKPIVVRTPIIPGFNDSEKDIVDIASFLRNIITLKSYELIPFHGFGTPKYEYLGRSCAFAKKRPLSAPRTKRLKLIAAEILPNII